jgi:outer membrane protein assembly factor BamB
MKRSILFISLISFLLSGCSLLNKFSGAGDDNTPPPAPLTNFSPQIHVSNIWTRSTNTAIGTDYLKLGPIAADGRIFTADPSGRVVATAPDGQNIWITHIHEPITSGPTVHDGIVVVGTGDGEVFALCENNGAVLWHTCVPNAVLAAPQIGEGYVVVKTVDGKVVALHAQNGEILWVYDHGSPHMVMRCGGAPQIADNKVIVGFSDGKLSALNLCDGSLIWEQCIAAPTGGSALDQMVDIVGDPVVCGDTVYVATYQGNVAAVSACNGNIFWQHCISSYTGLTLDNQHVYVTDAPGYVWAFDRATGNVDWRQCALYYRGLTPPVIAYNAVIVGDGQGVVHWLCPADGHFLARALVECKRRIITPPAVCGNTAFVLTSEGHLSAWRFW